MWLRHWLKQHRRKAWYKALKERYYAFHKDDVVKICIYHHEEVHQLYLPAIKNRCRLLQKDLSEFTQDEAAALSKRLTAICERWLLKETPGVEPRSRHP